MLGDRPAAQRFCCDLDCSFGRTSLRYRYQVFGPDQFLVRRIRRIFPLDFSAYTSRHQILLLILGSRACILVAITKVLKFVGLKEAFKGNWGDLGILGVVQVLFQISLTIGTIVLIEPAERQD